MLSKKTRTSRKGLPTYMVCEHCESTVVRETIETFMKVLFVETRNRKVQEKLICNGCKRELDHNEVKKLARQEYKEIKHDSGYIKKVRIERGETSSTTNITHDNRLTLPNSLDPELLSVTLVGIMTLMAKYDDSIDLKNSMHYQYIKDSYKEHDAAMGRVAHLVEHRPEDEARAYVISLFEDCKNELKGTDLDFMVSQSLGLTSGQLILKGDVNELFRDLLTIAGFGELGLDSSILSYRSKWMM